MREILIRIRAELATALREEDRDRMAAFVVNAHERCSQAILAVPQYEDMQKDLTEKDQQINTLEADRRALLDTLEGIISDATATFTAIEGEPVDPSPQTIDIHDIARKCAGVK